MIEFLSLYIEKCVTKLRLVSLQTFEIKYESKNKFIHLNTSKNIMFILQNHQLPKCNFFVQLAGIHHDIDR